MNKKAPRKLVLCTETLRNLTEQDLQHAAGGSVAASNCPRVCTDACTATYACSDCRPCL